MYFKSIASKIQFKIIFLAEENGSSFVPFETLLEQSDFIIITASLTPETKDLFDSKAFDKMKSTSILINTSRGGLINQDHLVQALEQKKILAAGLDVMTPEPLPTDHPLTK